MPAAPKDPRTRARTNKDVIEFKHIEVRPQGQPELPTVKLSEDDLTGEAIYLQWPDVTRDWWARWGRSPMARAFTEDDWDELRISAYLHAQFWLTGDIKAATELRNRTAKFGATPEDRARLRVQYVVADQAEKRAGQETVRDAHGKSAAEGGGARGRYGPLKAVD